MHRRRTPGSRSICAASIVCALSATSFWLFAALSAYVPGQAHQCSAAQVSGYHPPRSLIRVANCYFHEETWARSRLEIRDAPSTCYASHGASTRQLPAAFARLWSSGRRFECCLFDWECFSRDRVKREHHCLRCASVRTGKAAYCESSNSQKLIFDPKCCLIP